MSNPPSPFFAAATSYTTFVCPKRPGNAHNDHKSCRPCAANSGYLVSGTMTALYIIGAGLAKRVVVTHPSVFPLLTSVALVFHDPFELYARNEPLMSARAG